MGEKFKNSPRGKLFSTFLTCRVQQIQCLPFCARNTADILSCSGDKLFCDCCGILWSYCSTHFTVVWS